MLYKYSQLFQVFGIILLGLAALLIIIFAGIFALTGETPNTEISFNTDQTEISFITDSPEYPTADITFAIYVQAVDWSVAFKVRDDEKCDLIYTDKNGIEELLKVLPTCPKVN